MIQILGIASQSPTYFVPQSTAAEIAGDFCCKSEKERRLLHILYRRTKIESRATVLLEESEGRPNYEFYYLPKDPEDRGPGTRRRMECYERHAGWLAVRASLKALQGAEIRADEISHLITVSCTGFSAPGIDYSIITELGLPFSVERLHLGFMGCHASLNALRAAATVAQADPAARILICAVELCSLHFQYGWDPDRVVSNSLFADGAGAIVVGRRNPQDGKGWRIAGGSSKLFPNSADAMTWRIGDHGYVMTLSSKIPDVIRYNLAETVDSWLSQRGLRRSDIATWAIHPGGPRILEYTEQALEIDHFSTRVSREVLSKYGNMSSATMIYILSRMINDNSPLPCLALGFGPGLTVEMLLFGALGDKAPASEKEIEAW